MQQVPGPQPAGNPPPPQYSRGMQYFIGIMIGVVPLVLGLLSFGSNAIRNSSLFNYVFFGGLIVYAAVFIAMIVCLCITRVRFIGYGLLTMVLATPVIVFIACTLLIFRA